MFEDGSIEDACPPLRALLSIMANGSFEDKDAQHPEVRGLFTREALLESTWYHERLLARQRGDQRLWRRHVTTLDAWLSDNADIPLSVTMRQRRQNAAAELERVSSPAYRESLHGTLGTDPSLRSEL
jgi:hypothetical protein